LMREFFQDPWAHKVHGRKPIVICFFRLQGKPIWFWLWVICTFAIK
jgi:hypothetical protein